MRTILTTSLLAATLALSACGGDDDSDSSAAEPAAEPADAATDEPATDDAATEEPATDEPAAEPAEASSARGSGTATMTLANGESYEFSVLCSLEPQMAAGSEILFTVVSYDNPSLDITQFGDDGTVTGLASVSVYDAETYDTLWDAQSMFESFGGGVELTLDGSTVRGTGTFFPEGDIGATPVDGEVVANC